MTEKTKGGVSKKTINGKVYYYYQWYENGKRRSKTISAEEAEAIKKGETPLVFGEERFAGIEMFLGDALDPLLDPVREWKARYCLSSLLNFLSSSHPGRVYVLYGLRRTGKTTLMLQAIAQCGEKDRCAFLTLNNKATSVGLFAALRELRDRGFRHVFIDEVTAMSDFVEGAAFLADSFSRTMNVVLSGTDSLGFYFAAHNELYDRIEFVHTTYISFREFADVLGIRDIDQYIEYGGTFIHEGIDYHRGHALRFYDERSSISYVDGAIVNNILHSLSHYRDGYNFQRLKRQYDAGTLAGLIHRVIQDCNHRFLASVIQRRFKSHDYGSLKQLILSKENRAELVSFLEQIDEEKLYCDLMDALSILDPLEGLEQEDVEEMKRYLFVLDVIDAVAHVNVESGVFSEHILFSQPGLRYGQCGALIESLFRQEAFLSLPSAESTFLIETLKNDVKGRMLEDIVLLDRKKQGFDCFKATFLYGEYDMVELDKTRNTCSVYEIKHSDVIDSNQSRYLRDENMLSLLQSRFGTVSQKTVLYRGKDVENGEIHYRNVERFLMGE